MNAYTSDPSEIRDATFNLAAAEDVGVLADAVSALAGIVKTQQEQSAKDAREIKNLRADLNTLANCITTSAQVISDLRSRVDELEDSPRTTTINNMTL